MTESTTTIADDTTIHPRRSASKRPLRTWEIATTAGTVLQTFAGTGAANQRWIVL